MPHLDNCITSHFSVLHFLNLCVMLYTKHMPDQINSIAQSKIRQVTIEWISQPDTGTSLRFIHYSLIFTENYSLYPCLYMSHTD